MVVMLPKPYQVVVLLKANQVVKLVSKLSYPILKIIQT